MMTGDKWAHQYMAQPNQPHAVNTTADDGSIPPVFTTANSGVSTTFGMEPQYPCCTVNHPQGYPKFVANSWVTVGQTGLGHALLSPSSVATELNGGSITVTCDTSYPFDNKLAYSVQADKSFDLYLRVPDWASSFSVSGASTEPTEPDGETGMTMVQVDAGESEIIYELEIVIHAEPRANDTVAIFYGNLLYALDVGATNTSSYPHAYNDATGPGLDYLPFQELRDYYIDSTSDWSVAIDPSTLTYHGINGAKLPDPIFEQGAPPSYIEVDGCEIKWDLYLTVTPDWAPKDRTCIGEKKSYRLIPYGAAKVHMSDLPVTTF